jgi:glycosyltransferase involved in cell wall biosynthesis
VTRAVEHGGTTWTATRRVAVAPSSRDRSRIRVLHFIAGLDNGGAEAMLARLVTAPTEDVEHVVVSLRKGGFHVARLRSHNVVVHEHDISDPRQAASAPWLFAKVVRDFAPDVIQGWMYHGNLVAQLAPVLARRRARTKVIIGIRCTEHSLTSAFRPVVKIDAGLSRFADLMIANSHSGLDFHLAHGYRPPRSAVVHNGVDVDLFKPDPAVRAQMRAALHLAPDARVLIHVANVRPLKNHGLLLEALRSVPQCTALLVGDGTAELDLPANARALGRRDDVERLLAAADLTVNTSWSEGFCNAIAEAMAAGLPGVCTAVGDTAMIVGDTGWLVPPRVDAFAAALREALNLSPEELADQGRRARARICEKFTLSAAVHRFTGCYFELAGRTKERERGISCAV